jgi:hypothetical protein
MKWLIILLLGFTTLLDAQSFDWCVHKDATVAHFVTDRAEEVLAFQLALNADNIKTWKYGEEVWSRYWRMMRSVLSYCRSCLDIA